MNMEPDTLSLAGPVPRPVTRMARVVLCGVVLFTIAYALAIMILTVRMPAQIDVWEGKVLCEAYRWAQTGTIYDDPMTQGAATIYTPLYPVLLGWAAGWLPPALMWGRLLSLLATLCTAACIVGYCGLLRRGHRLAAGLTLAVFFSCAWHTQWFAVMIKNDALCHALWIAGLWLATGRRSPALVLSAVLTALAFYAKQTAVFAVPGILLFLWLENRPRAARWAVTYVVALVAGWFLFRWLAGPQMGFYLFGRTATQVGRTLPGATMWRVLFSIRETPLLIAGTLAALCAWPRLRSNPRYRAALCVLPVVFAGSVWTTTAPGAASNSMMPLYFVMTILTGLAAKIGTATQAFEWRGALVTALLLGLQFDAMAPYRVSKSLGRFDRDFVATVDFLREQPGAVYAPSHNVFSLLLNRPVYDDVVLAREIGWHFRETGPVDRIRDHVNRGRFEWLIMDIPHRDTDLFTPPGRQRYALALETDTWQIFRRLNAVPEVRAP